MLKEWDSITDGELQDAIFEHVAAERLDLEEEERLDKALADLGLDFTVENLADSEIFQCDKQTWPATDSPAEYCEEFAYPGSEYCKYHDPDFGY